MLIFDAYLVLFLFTGMRLAYTRVGDRRREQETRRLGLD